MTIGEKITHLRIANKISQEQLAEKIDRTPAFIGHVEAPNISKAVSLDTLFDIAKVLNVPVYKFWAGPFSVARHLFGLFW